MQNRLVFEAASRELTSRRTASLIAPLAYPNDHTVIKNSKKLFSIISDPHSKSLLRKPSLIMCRDHECPGLLFCVEPGCTYKSVMCRLCLNQQRVHIYMHGPMKTIEELEAMFSSISENNDLKKLQAKPQNEVCELYFPLQYQEITEQGQELLSLFDDKSDGIVQSYFNNAQQNQLEFHSIFQQAQNILKVQEEKLFPSANECDYDQNIDFRWADGDVYTDSKLKGIVRISRRNRSRRQYNIKHYQNCLQYLQTVTNEYLNYSSSCQISEILKFQQIQRLRNQLFMMLIAESLLPHVKKTTVKVDNTIELIQVKNLEVEQTTQILIDFTNKSIILSLIQSLRDGLSYNFRLDSLSLNLLATRMPVIQCTSLCLILSNDPKPSVGTLQNIQKIVRRVNDLQQFSLCLPQVPIESLGGNYPYISLLNSLPKTSLKQFRIIFNRQNRLAATQLVDLGFILSGMRLQSVDIRLNSAFQPIPKDKRTNPFELTPKNSCLVQLISSLSQIDTFKKISLGLSNNSLDDSCVKTLTTLIAGSPNLEHLSLNLCHNETLSEKPLRQLAKCLSRAPNLLSCSLNISGIQLSENRLLQICSFLNYSKTLKDIELNIVQCVAEGLKPSLISLFRDYSFSKSRRFDIIF